MARAIAVLVGRLIFGCIFLMAAYFKFTGMEATAGYIASIGFPLPTVFAWLAAFFELALVLAFFTGILFSPAAVVAGLYVIFLGFAFHGPATWGANPMEFGFFTDHFTFLAGLLFAAAHGPGDKLVIKWPR
jgi:putative oxidoreductase